ncbi:monovalent cation/H(+) antiporter subunit G [Nakamurella flavida]|uniref:Monovalent cation/H(+) antiporter subunit G n=1 Tax=Nakamurella flavida TaxID=363630 RepID=A0A938YP61_9ACTN|nr:monovalent cation/H(+) antiporter subunit G [Nakamurella flavida]MBM9478338.1 monovalent cation/H(+) antiporter subunit G [Nakamurella flavida]MDP9777490.1 multicomponent Na+:H+ antiporter subunit G [Nakamurella flavida]
MSVVDTIASVCLVGGALLSMLAGIAVLRFPDTMSRIHAATKPQVLGIVLLMIGLGLRLGTVAIIGELALIVVLQFVTAPVAAHLTVRAAFRGEQEDQDAQPDGLSGHGAEAAGADDTPTEIAHALVDENVGADPDHPNRTVLDRRPESD